MGKELGVFWNVPSNGHPDRKSTKESREIAINTLARMITKVIWTGMDVPKFKHYPSDGKTLDWWQEDEVRGNTLKIELDKEVDGNYSEGLQRHFFIASWWHGPDLMYSRCLVISAEDFGRYLDCFDLYPAYLSSDKPKRIARYLKMVEDFRTSVRGLKHQC
jgi:hypothetical protein